jgi:predicted RNase H-like nuclease
MDGCRAGWFYFRQRGKALTYGLASDIFHLSKSLPEHTRIYIDIPIGLLESGTVGRHCDQEARQLLGRARSSSVFSAPIRPVLAAHNYEEAKKISAEIIGKKLSIQAFAIAPKIKEIDEFLLNNGHKFLLREVHPELAFWALNERKAMTYNKKTRRGFEERLYLLGQFVPKCHQLVEEVLRAYPRKELARDDILDALVVLVVACTSDSSLKTVPDKPAIDSRGIPMEIVYTENPNEDALQ